MPEQQTRLLAERYELIAPLGRGTMGTVWRARDRALGREVAVKEIRQDPGLTEEQRTELRERMVREGRLASRINHPSVAAIHDVLIQDNSPWIIMELIEARSLEQVIEEEGPLPPRLVAEIGVDLLGALRAAHAQGITHRDVKPGNVLITESGRVVLTDFGIAKAEGDSRLTKTGMVIGSPGYTAPERARGEYTGPESDIWSLGATLYFAVEGRPAYERATIAETLAALLSESADPPTQAGQLRPVLNGLLNKDYRQRLSAAKAETLMRMVADTPTSEMPVLTAEALIAQEAALPDPFATGPKPPTGPAATPGGPGATGPGATGPGGPGAGAPSGHGAGAPGGAGAGAPGGAGAGTPGGPGAGAPGGLGAAAQGGRGAAVGGAAGERGATIPGGTPARPHGAAAAQAAAAGPYGAAGAQGPASGPRGATSQGPGPQGPTGPQGPARSPLGAPTVPQGTAPGQPGQPGQAQGGVPAPGQRQSGAPGQPQGATAGPPFGAQPGNGPQNSAFPPQGTGQQGTAFPPQGTGPQGTGPQGTGPQGTGPQGTGPQGTGPQGTGPQGTGPQGTGPQGTGPQGTGPQGSAFPSQGTGPQGGAFSPQGSPQGTQPHGVASQGTAPHGVASQGGGQRGPGAGEGEYDPERTVSVMRPKGPFPSAPEQGGPPRRPDDEGTVTTTRISSLPNAPGHQVYPPMPQQGGMPQQGPPMPQQPGPQGPHQGDPQAGKGLGTDLFAIARQPEKPAAGNRNGMLVLMAVAAAAAVVIAVLIVALLSA